MPSDCRGADQFQGSHRDGYGDHLASALDRARKGWTLNAAEASALVAEVERLQTMRRHALSDLPPCYTPSSVGDGLSLNPLGGREG